MRAPEFWYPENGRLSRTGFFLAPIGWLYHGLGRAKQLLITGQRASVPVICLGNLTAGGTGKTPLCIALVPILREMGFVPHFLTRGYGGSISGPLRVDPYNHTCDQVGDEPLLLAESAPTWVSPDRVKGANAATGAGATIIIMDDGYQNPSLIKDISFVVVDRVRGFGNGQVIPAGPLREFVRTGLQRADAVIYTGDASVTPPQSQSCIKEFDLRAFHSRLVVDDLTPADADKAPTPIVAFAGIGQPQKFFDALTEKGYSIAEAVPYPDHHNYSRSDLDWLHKLADEREAMLVTTSKDFVRLDSNSQANVSFLPVEATFEDEPSLRAFLKERLAPQSQ